MKKLLILLLFFFQTFYSQEYLFDNFIFFEQVNYNTDNSHLIVVYINSENPSYYIIHSSQVNHYHSEYPMEKYSQNSIIKQIINNV